MSEIDFVKVLRDAGIPTTQAELTAAWSQVLTDTGSRISNNSAYSPFWRLTNALVTTPVLWLLDFVATTLMPSAFVRYAKGAFLDLQAWAVNLERKPAVAAVGTVTFHRPATVGGLTVAAGQIIQSPVIGGVVYSLQTTTAAVFAPGASTATATATATATGAAFNLGEGYYTIPAATVPGCDSVTNGVDWLTVPGADEETDDDLRKRIRNQFGTAGKFHSDAVYRSLIASFPGVGVDSVWFLHEAPRGPGTANAYILFSFDAPVSAYLAAINTYITDEGHHGHGDDLLVLQMPTASVDLAVSVWIPPTTLPADRAVLLAGVTDFVRCAFRENTAYDSATHTFPYSRFSFSKLGKELHEQFPLITSLDFNLSDIVSELSIPRLGNLAIAILDAEA